MLAQMIRFYGHAMQGMMGAYLEDGIPHLEMLIAPQKDAPFIA